MLGARRTLASAVLVLLPACSHTEGEVRVPTNPEVTCVPTWAPVTDLTWAAILFAGTGLMLHTASGLEPTESSIAPDFAGLKPALTIMSVLAVAGGTVFTASAVHGFSEPCDSDWFETSASPVVPAALEDATFTQTARATGCVSGERLRLKDYDPKRRTWTAICRGTDYACQAEGDDVQCRPPTETATSTTTSTGTPAMLRE